MFTGTRQFRRHRGQAMVLMVLLMTVIATGGALAVDVGTAYVFRERTGFVLEAAALAAAAHLPDTAAARAAAVNVAGLNGLDPARVVVTTSYGGDSSRLRVSYGQDRPTFFGRVFGVDLLRVNNQAVAARNSPVMFDYAIFSGSTFEKLDLTGMNLNVTGSIHANENIRIRGATVNVSGTLQAAGLVDVRGSVVRAGTVRNYVASIPMPMLDQSELRAMCATRFTGSQHWSGTTINLDGNVFVDGDLKLSGVRVTGQGMLMATGDIELAGTSLRYLNPSTDRLAIYSLRDIKITGTNFVVDGIIYAPHGQVRAHGSSLTINGQIIADEVDFSGVNVTIHHNSAASSVLPLAGVRLTR